ncbi:unnamed protein product [Leptosia nina]|uniref:Secreted protein n=1 Tax=Leptosia nina TaxID=320188 RepID=A0AAV1JRL0_9NEOP
MVSTKATLAAVRAIGACACHCCSAQTLESRLRSEFRRSRPLIYISLPIWVNNCPRSVPPSAVIHLATPNHCSPNAKRSLGSTTGPMVW